MKTIIVAAGQGFRLRSEAERMPKTLLPFGKGTILSHVMDHFAAVGVSDFVVVIGCRGEQIVDYLREHDHFGHHVDFAENPNWLRGNGLSVAYARPYVTPGEPAFLSMSDHLVPPEALAAIRDASSEKNLLLTDARIDSVFDLDDATKVLVEEERILDIGKEIHEYNTIDCGVFRLTERFFDALDLQIADAKESISDAVRLLVEADDMESVPIPAGASWIDVDTPESYRHALEHRDAYLAQVHAPSRG